MIYFCYIVMKFSFDKKYKYNFNTANIKRNNKIQLEGNILLNSIILPFSSTNRATVGCP